MKIGTAALCLAVLAVTAASAYWGYGKYEQKQLHSALVEKIRSDLVYIEGGDFETGNYKIDFQFPSGARRLVSIVEDMPLPSRRVTLENYYLSAYETSYSDFNVYLRAQGYPVLEPQEYRRYLPDHAAALSLEEASAYCAWLGEQVGTIMRLPTEAEWEFAARSRGQNPAWATDDGNFRPGENLAYLVTDDLTAADRDPPIGSYPPNPLGLYNLADGLYEWVSDRAPSDPDGSAIGKGASNFTSRFTEVIPRRIVVERLTDKARDDLLQVLAPEDRQRLMRQKDPLSPYRSRVTARCAASETREPAQSGFGTTPGPVQFNPPFYAEGEHPPLVTAPAGE